MDSGNHSKSLLYWSTVFHYSLHRLIVDKRKYYMQHKLKVEPTGGFACSRIGCNLEQHTLLLDSIP